MSTVYIFGAGASKHAGYPLISDMGEQWLDWMANYPGGRYQGSSELLAQIFGKSPNIEDVITEIESVIRAPAEPNDTEHSRRRTILGSTHGQLFESLREWFRELRRNPAEKYAQFAQNIILPGDSVLTFNYDDVLERELCRAGKWDLSGGYGFQLGAEDVPSSTLVLKLHGSINWLAVLFGGITSGAMAVGGGGSLGHHPVIHKADAQHFGYTDFVGHTYKGGGAIPSLILPGRNKEFFFRTSFGVEWQLFFDHLWGYARVLLDNAEKIVVCGYSMLPIDKRACDMIFKVRRKETPVEVVSGSQSRRIAREFREAGFTNVSAHRSGYFEDWIGDFSSRTFTQASAS